MHRYAIYVQDYGAPIGWRLALADPEAVLAVVSQNGNAYEEGFVPEFWEPIWTYGAHRSPENEAGLRPALGREAVEWQYTHGVPDPSLIDPDAWEHDLALLARPGVDRAQLALFGDYAATAPSTRRCTTGCGRAVSPSSQSGAATTRSSRRRARRHSGATPRTRRSSCSTEATSCWRATSTPSPRPSSDSARAYSARRSADDKERRSGPPAGDAVDGEAACRTAGQGAGLDPAEATRLERFPTGRVGQGRR